MLYPRIVTFSREPLQIGEGKKAYGGRRAADEERVPIQNLIAKDVRANVQARREGQRNPVGLPADGTKATWRIFTPRGVIAAGAVRDGDIATDDLGRRFQVTSDYCHNLGCTFSCERLEP